MSDITDLFGPVISTYSRAQAIADGTLVDVTETAKEASLRFPTAVTSAVWHTYVEFPEDLKGFQNESGRLWDILSMLRFAITARRIKGVSGTFELLVLRSPNDGIASNERPEPNEEGLSMRLVTLKCVCGPGDTHDPALTIMLPDED